MSRCDSACQKRKYKRLTATAAQREAIRQMANAWNARWKAAAHAALGGICVHCGFSDSRALQIDHVRGGGNTERKKWYGAGSFYKKVVAQADSGKYQLLCANCNWIKRDENGEI